MRRTCFIFAVLLIPGMLIAAGKHCNRCHLPGGTILEVELGGTDDDGSIRDADWFRRELERCRDFIAEVDSCNPYQSEGDRKLCEEERARCEDFLETFRHLIDPELLKRRPPKPQPPLRPQPKQGDSEGSSTLGRRKVEIPPPILNDNVDTRLGNDQAGSGGVSDLFGPGRVDYPPPIPNSNADTRLGNDNLGDTSSILKNIRPPGADKAQTCKSCHLAE